jgi:hypothetical protein
MQRVMMMPVLRPCRAVLLFSLLALVAGCALRPAQPAQQSAPPNSLTITSTDLQKAEQEAYNQGFDAGRRYQRKRDQQQAGTTAGANAPPQDTAQPDAQVPAVDAQAPATPDNKTSLPASATAPGPSASSTACPPQGVAKPATPTPLPPLPPSSSYTTSGPAQPLSQ